MKKYVASFCKIMEFFKLPIKSGGRKGRRRKDMVILSLLSQHERMIRLSHIVFIKTLCIIFLFINLFNPRWGNKQKYVGMKSRNEQNVRKTT